MTATPYNRQQLLRDLRDNVVEVHFIKQDGTQRIMRCSLMDRHIPPIPENKVRIDESLAKNPNLIVAWDVENKGWRSFHIDSIFYVQALAQDF